MTVEQVPHEKSQHRRPFSASGSPDRKTDAVTPRLKNPLIEKCLKQLVKKGLFGHPYAQYDNFRGWGPCQAWVST